MTGIALALVLHTSMLMTTTTTAASSYGAARKDCNKTGRPMIVLVGAQWCPACVEMKNTIMPKVRRRGLLRRVAFAEVDLDRQKKLGYELTDGGPIPQVIMYRKTHQGWRRRRLIGGHSVETVSTFIEEGIRLNEEARKEDTKKPHREQEPNAASNPDRTT